MSRSSKLNGSPDSAPDPLRQLEAELSNGDGGQSADERLYEEAQGLVEEAWGVFTECLVIRDSLLEACKEIERAMSGMQSRLDDLSITAERDDAATPVNGLPHAPVGAGGANGSTGANDFNGANDSTGASGYHGAHDSTGANNPQGAGGYNGAHDSTGANGYHGPNGNIAR